MSVSLQFRAALVFRYYSFVSTMRHLQCKLQHFARASKKPRIGEIVHRKNLKSGGVSTFLDDNSLMKLITHRLCKFCLDIHVGHRAKIEVRPMNWFRLPKQGASKNAECQTQRRKDNTKQREGKREPYTKKGPPTKTAHRLVPPRGPRHE